MTSTSTLVTAEQFWELPEPRDGGKMELVRGEVVCMSPVGYQHGEVAGAVSAALRPFARKHRLGGVGVEVGFRVAGSPDTVLAPDAHFLARERVPTGSDASRFVEGAPTLAVEVVSPNDRDIDVQAKVEAYLAAGSERVWVTRPEQQSVTVYRPDGTARIFHAGDVLTSEDAAFAVDGFELAVAEIFAS